MVDSLIRRRGGDIVRMSLFVMSIGDVTAGLLVVSWSRFQVVGAIVMEGGVIAPGCSLIRRLRGISFISVASNSAGIRWSGIVTRFLVPVATSGINWRRIISSLCDVFVLLVGATGCIRWLSVVRASCCCMIDVVLIVLVVVATRGIIASSGISCCSIIRSRRCVVGCGWSCVASSGVRRSSVVRSFRRVVSWSFSLVTRSGIRRRSV